MYTLKSYVKDNKKQIFNNTVKYKNYNRRYTKHIFFFIKIFPIFFHSRDNSSYVIVNVYEYSKGDRYIEFYRGYYIKLKKGDYGSWASAPGTVKARKRVKITHVALFSANEIGVDYKSSYKKENDNIGDNKLF